MGDSVKNLAEFEVDDIHSFPFIYPASHALIESYHFGQAGFPLGESMLTTPDNLLLLHLLRVQLLESFIYLLCISVQ